jgi:hypothetical protein
MAKLGRIRLRDREAVSARGGLFEIRIDRSSSVAVHLRAGAPPTHLSSPGLTGRSSSVPSMIDSLEVKVFYPA